MNAQPLILRVCEYLFLFSSTISNSIRLYEIEPVLGLIYSLFIVSYLLSWLRLRPARGPALGIIMYSSPLFIYNAFIFYTLLLSRISNAQSESKTATRALAEDVTTTSSKSVFTVPSDAQNGASILPNIKDPEAVDAQSVCPGYSASSVVRTISGLTATLKLAGTACNLYGTDIETLNLTVEYQSADRLALKISPAVIDSSNASQYIIPDNIVQRPSTDPDADASSLTSDLEFVWSNKPTFSFSVIRVSTGDKLFSTENTILVFENQFVEFVSTLPENYNLYGLGESIHSLRLGNNYTKTIYAVDVGDVID